MDAYKIILTEKDEYDHNVFLKRKKWFDCPANLQETRPLRLLLKLNGQGRCLKVLL